MQRSSIPAGSVFMAPRARDLTTSAPTSRRSPRPSNPRSNAPPKRVISSSSWSTHKQARPDSTRRSLACSELRAELRKWWWSPTRSTAIHGKPMPWSSRPLASEFPRSPARSPATRSESSSNSSGTKSTRRQHCTSTRRSSSRSSAVETPARARWSTRWPVTNESSPARSPGPPGMPSTCRSVSEIEP